MFYTFLALIFVIKYLKIPYINCVPNFDIILERFLRNFFLIHEKACIVN